MVLFIYFFGGGGGCCSSHPLGRFCNSSYSRSLRVFLLFPADRANQRAWLPIAPCLNVTHVVCGLLHVYGTLLKLDVELELYGEAGSALANTSTIISSNHPKRYLQYTVNLRAFTPSLFSTVVIFIFMQLILYQCYQSQRGRPVGPHVTSESITKTKKCPTSGERLIHGYTKFDFTVDEGKGTAESFSRYKFRQAPQKEGGEIPCEPR